MSSRKKQELILKAKRPFGWILGTDPLEALKLRICLIRYLLLWVVLFYSQKASSGETFNFRNYSVKEGMANSTVYYIFQDSKGFIWFATESGVNRFDGHKFELFTMDNGLSDNEVLQIQEDSEGRIWFLTLNGRLSYYHNQRFYNPSNSALLKKSTTPGSFISFYEDADHNLWFGTNQNRLLKIDRHADVRFFSSQKYSLSNCLLTQASSKAVLAINKKYAFIFTGDRHDQIPSSLLPLSPQSYIFEKKSRSTLFMSDAGLVRFRNNQFTLLAKLKGTGNIATGSIMMDERNRLWIGTMGEGILLYKSLDQKPERHLTGENITHIIKDKENNIWIGTIGSGVFFLPFYTNNAIHLTTRDGLGSNAITRVIKIGPQLVLGFRSGNLDIVTPDKIIHKTFNKGNTYNPVKNLYYDPRRKSIWYASDNKMLELHPSLGNINILKSEVGYAIKSFSFNSAGDLAIAHASGIYIKGRSPSLLTSNRTLKNSCFLKRTFTVHYDSSGRLWFSNLLGLQYYERGKIKELYKEIPLLRQRVTDIGELPDKTIVCTTYGFGVAVLQDGRLKGRYTTANGLGSNICKKVFIERNKAWIVTGKGISVIDFNEKPGKVVSYTTEDGLISDEVNDVYAGNDTAYVATNNGLSVFSPQSSVKRKAPPLYFKSVLVNKRLVSPQTYPLLKHNQNNITVNFIALDYAHPSRIHYKYRLHRDSRWNETQGTTLEFGSLEPGEYHLEISGKSVNTPWGPPAGIKFKISPPVWKTWWFITMEILGSVAILFLVIRNYFKTKQSKEKEMLITKTRIISLEQQALQAMMNPHFIFNVMNSIQYFINTKDKTMANQALTGFARLIRKNLEICNKSYISIEEEINYLNLYLSLEKLRFGEKMQYQISIDKEIDLSSTFVPSMLLQPYVENAIWHGIMPKDENGNILIDVKKENSYLTIKIKDDGIGIENSQKINKGEHISRGMQLTMQRINLLNKFKKQSILIDIRQVPEGGTEVTISLPLQPFTK